MEIGDREMVVVYGMVLVVGGKDGMVAGYRDGEDGGLEEILWNMKRVFMG